MDYTKEALNKDVEWLMSYGISAWEAMEFCITLSHKESKLVQCASNGCICEFGTEDLSNTTCNICGEEAK